MTNERFHYRGPALLDGIEFPDVRLREERDGGLRSWEGETSFPASAPPSGFSPDLAHAGTVAVRLPDGREGNALVTNLSFDGASWSLSLQGTGPAPR
ncbi:hypothetical protein ACFCZR_06330 [Streptomyces rubiginosohelvolus]|uniref:hypothetical protein n=1 Tax=Streptomyces rubiginosohelvolus TaxID=67362 RepID=UPI0035DF8610